MLSHSLLSRRGVIVVAAFLLALAGRHAFRSMPRALEPPIDASYAAIEMQLPGASVAEIETLLTSRVERELLALQDITSLRAQTRDGAVVLLVGLSRDPVVREATYGRIEERLVRLRADFGADFIGLSGPHLLRAPKRYPEILVSLASEAATGGAPRHAGRILAERLRALPEVSHVEIVGEPLTRIVMTYDDRDLVDTGLSPLKLREFLKSQSFTAPGGYLDRGDTLAPVETAVRLTSIDDLAQLPVRDPDDGATVSLGRILKIEREALAPVTEEVRVGDAAGIVLAVTRGLTTNLDDFDRAVRAAVAEPVAVPPASKEGPAKAEILVSQAEPVEREITGFTGRVIESFVLLLVLLVVALGFRSGLAVAVVVPLVVAASFIGFDMLSLGLDFVVLSSLVLVLGILVDNHIVIAERVHRLREHGLDAATAIGQALRELVPPLAVATAITICGFLPVEWLDHAIGSYVRPLFYVVLASLLVSLAFSVFVTPLLLRRRAWSARATTDRMGWYRRILDRNATPARAALLIMFVVLASYFGALRIQAAEQVFLPTSSQPYLTVDVVLPQGTDVDRTREEVSRVSSALLSNDGIYASTVERAVSFLGRSVPPFQASLARHAFEPHYGQILVRLKDGGDVAELEKRLLTVFAGTDAKSPAPLMRVRRVRLGAELEWPIVVRLRGESSDLLAAGKEVEAKLAELGCRNVGTDRAAPIAKLRIEPDRQKLSEKGLTAADLTAAMHSVVHGLPVFDIADTEGRTPVVLRAKPSRKDPVETLREAYVYPSKGEPSLLYEVGEVRSVSADPISTRDRGRPSLEIHAEASAATRDLAIEREIADWLAKLRETHPGIDCEVDGVYASSRAANEALLKAVPWAALLVLILLLLSSRSVGETLLIVATIPLAGVGVALALTATGQPFSFMVLVGLIALAGLVVNNAIVLIASLRNAKESHTTGDLRATLVQAASERFRPLVLTTLCAIVSMAVLYRSGGPMWQPLAMTIMSGLVFATAMVVTVLPAIYIAFASNPTRQPE